MSPIVLGVAAVWYGIASVLALGVFMGDKWRASWGAHRRVPERTLHALSWLGGFAGSLVAIHWGRHKSAKPRFVAFTWVAAVAHAAAWGVLAAAVIRRGS